MWDSSNFNPIVCWWLGLCFPPVKFLAWGSPILQSVGSMGGLKVITQRSSVNRCLSGPVLAVPLSLPQSTADPFLCRRPSNPHSRLVQSLVPIPLSWCAQGFVCAFQDSLFLLALWKFYNQIQLSFEVKFPRDSQSLCCIPNLWSLIWG